jgi:peroxiredoxin Q/BCP
VLKAGDRAPEFSLPDESGAEVSLTNLLHHGSLILYFYPSDFTPVCTKEACMVQDLHPDILRVGLNVAGISPNDADSHQRFKTKHALSFPLLADPERHVARMFGVIGPLGFGVRRATFLIDQQRVIQNYLVADLLVGRHEEFVRRAIMLRELAAGGQRDV